GSLGAGARLVLEQPGEHRNIEHALDLVRRERVTVMQAVPTTLRAMLEHPASAACSTLKHVFCAGEAMPPELPGRFYARWSAHLHNAYGPTEATIDATCAYVS